MTGVSAITGANTVLSADVRAYPRVGITSCVNGSRSSCGIRHVRLVREDRARNERETCMGDGKNVRTGLGKLVGKKKACVG